MYKIFCKNFKKVLTNNKKYIIMNISNEREVKRYEKISLQGRKQKGLHWQH